MEKTKRGSGRWIIGCIVLFFVGLAGLGVAGWVFYLSARGLGGEAERPTEGREQVALADGTLLAFGGGILGPFTVRRVVQGTASSDETWVWTGPSGRSSHPWPWSAGPGVVAGELHATQGNVQPMLAVFDPERGHLASIDDLVSGSWQIAADGRVIAGTRTSVRVARVQPGLAPVVTGSALPAGQFVPWVGATPAHVVVWNGTLSAFGADGTGTARTIAPLTDVVGIAAQRDEILVLRDGRVVAVSLASGADRVSIDLAGAGANVTDGLDDPCLLGSAGGRWLLVYSTGLDHSTAVNGRNWLTPAERTLAAVDAQTGQVAWRTPLGPWLAGCRPGLRHVISDDADVGPELLMYGERDEDQGTTQSGTLIDVATDTGAIRWRAQYPAATRSNHLFVRRGAATYLKVNDARDILRWALLRFEGGRLTGASWLPRMEEPSAPAITARRAWVAMRTGWVRLDAPALTIGASEGSRDGFSDARAWAIERLSLPTEAR